MGKNLNLTKEDVELITAAMDSLCFQQRSSYDQDNDTDGELVEKAYAILERFREL
jgi:hypothetical protein